MEVPSQLHLLAERDDVRRALQVEVLVAPHLARWSAPRLHFVHKQRRPVLARYFLQPLKQKEGNREPDVVEVLSMLRADAMATFFICLGVQFDTTVKTR